jgi:hypothetical protein
MTYLAHIDGQRFAIADEAVDTFAASIVAALRSGGNFVDVPLVSGADVRLLITTASSVRLEQVPEPTEDVSDGEEFVDFAFYDLEP